MGQGRRPGHKRISIRILGSQNASHGNILIVYVQCKRLCFVDLSSEKKIPQFNFTQLFQEVASMHLSMEWTPLAVSKWKARSPQSLYRSQLLSNV